MSVADDLHEGVLNALAARDFQAVVDILEVLAKYDLDRAARLYGDLQDALSMASLLQRLAGEGEA